MKREGENTMNKYQGTQTEKNLQAAFAGESQARNKYTYFSSVAKKEGYEQIAAIFLKTADNEKEHAKMWFKELNGIGDTKANLAAASEGENFESLRSARLRPPACFRKSGCCRPRKSRHHLPPDALPVS